MSFAPPLPKKKTHERAMPYQSCFVKYTSFLSQNIIDIFSPNKYDFNLFVEKLRRRDPGYSFAFDAH